MARDKTDGTDESPTAIPATQGANEWGIPDWRDADAYGDVRRWTFYRWRWEFYRRREDLRYCFETALSQQTPEMDFMFKGRPRRGQPGFYVHASTRWTFGYLHRLPDPSVSNHPDDLLFAIDEAFPPVLIEWDRGDENEYSVPEIRVPVANAAVVVFDLDKPLEPQLAIATRAMKWSQRHIHGNKSLQKRRHPLKWLGYLRSLDAREDGASWADMTALFFADGLLDRRKDPSGGYCAPPPQAARDMWLAADALRLNF